MKVTFPMCGFQCVGPNVSLITITIVTITEQVHLSTKCSDIMREDAELLHGSQIVHKDTLSHVKLNLCLLYQKVFEECSQSIHC